MTSCSAESDSMSPQPATLPVLLRALGMNHASAAQQKVAVGDWLADNAPSPELRTSLRRNGFGLLLAQRSPTVRGRAAR
jgi:hypothetical protein